MNLKRVPRITMAKLIKWKACWLNKEDGEARVSMASGGAKSMSLVDALELDDGLVSWTDKLWLVEKALPKKLYLMLAYETSKDAIRFVSPREYKACLKSHLEKFKGYAEGTVDKEDMEDNSVLWDSRPAGKDKNISAWRAVYYAFDMEPSLCDIFEQANFVDDYFNEEEQKQFVLDFISRYYETGK